MPQLPLWFRRIPEILEDLRKPDAPSFLDRPAVEKRFRVGRRQAIRLLADAGGAKAGNSSIVERETLIRHLRAIEESGAAPEARARRRKIELAVGEVPNYAQAQRVRIETGPGALRIRPAGLPESVDLVAPGKLQIAYSGAEDLLARIVELAAAAANDFVAFRNLYEGSR